MLTSPGPEVHYRSASHGIGGSQIAVHVALSTPPEAAPTHFPAGPQVNFVEHVSRHSLWDMLPCSAFAHCVWVHEYFCPVGAGGGSTPHTSWHFALSTPLTLADAMQVIDPSFAHTYSAAVGRGVGGGVGPATQTARHVDLLTPPPVAPTHRPSLLHVKLFEHWLRQSSCDTPV